MEAILSPKGEILIPEDLMARYGWKAGTTVVLEARDGEIALRPAGASPKARLVHRGGDTLLEAPPGAPQMTPQNVKRLLEEWP
jgi:AbrB family looped-hinge helix DNA binding protein